MKLKLAIVLMATSGRATAASGPANSMLRHALEKSGLNVTTDAGHYKSILSFDMNSSRGGMVSELRRTADGSWSEFKLARNSSSRLLPDRVEVTADTASGVLQTDHVLKIESAYNKVAAYRTEVVGVVPNGGHLQAVKEKEIVMVKRSTYRVSINQQRDRFEFFWETPDAVYVAELPLGPMVDFQISLSGQAVIFRDTQGLQTEFLINKSDVPHPNKPKVLKLEVEPNPGSKTTFNLRDYDVRSRRVEGPTEIKSNESSLGLGD